MQINGYLELFENTCILVFKIGNKNYRKVIKISKDISSYAARVVAVGLSPVVHLWDLGL